MSSQKTTHIVNTTFSVDKATTPTWLEWIKGTHLPSLHSTGLFDSYTLMKITSIGDDTGDTFCCHLNFTNEQDFRRYMTETQIVFENKISEKFGQQVLFFSTVLEVI